MSHKLVVSIRNITEEQWNSILETAAAHGWTAEFYADEDKAAQAALDAEVVFADSPKFVTNSDTVRWIISPSAGVNHFTRSDAFRAKDIMLSNSSGAYGVTISEHIIMAALTMMRYIPEYEAEIKSRNWTRGITLKSIKNCRATLLGTGDIGTETAKRLRGFDPENIVGVNTRGTDPDGIFDQATPVTELDSILPKTDLLIMSLPATENTYHIMDRDKLALLPDGAVIVNVGRGNTIDEEALVEELKSGRLRAALDVFEKEPIPEDSELWDCPNLLITPHVAGDMFLPYTVQKIVDLFIEDFERYVRGEKPLRLVDLDKGY